MQRADFHTLILQTYIKNYGIPHDARPGFFLRCADLEYFKES